MLAIQLAFSTVMVVATVIVHLVGLLLLFRIVDVPESSSAGRGAILGDVARVTGAALGLFALHTIEIWA